MKEFTKEPLEELIYVSQTGGRNIKIKCVMTGFESLMDARVLFDNSILTKKGVIYVFRKSDERYLGYIIREEYDLPKKHLDEDGSFFKDFYTSTYKDAYGE